MLISNLIIHFNFSFVVMVLLFDIVNVQHITYKTNKITKKYKKV